MVFNFPIAREKGPRPGRYAKTGEYGLLRILLPVLRGNGAVAE